ncbi:hypothetical protein GZH47_33475 (plasmid) [Paenibacillus rhizovicinus]|uniref:Uncharacterized protein n=1 Tax=Paenibacillus rhizovicinus TaxID=2704463 RepID=A0A6C0PBQ8_9BACL|nr:hypothetical protein [Paenibacillus rhizovicinus]QHW35805.1 hypothetical protein GZH47_33475 [Paenibacillus rhizovicinus]
MDPLVGMMVDMMIAGNQEAAAIYDSITGIDEMSDVPMSNEVLSLIYVPCDVKTIGSDYYLIHEGKVVYMGHIDNEGLVDTVIKDITTLPEFINVGIAAKLNDRAKLGEFLSNEETLLKIMSQQQLGLQYLEENHGPIDSRKVN